ncbi:hypothetical protein C8R44DRAFT_870731 [Mycena epipterygia]|nr:hypothetical protein C8R44DRAFT_870731 [Mycena epipterygia]
MRVNAAPAASFLPDPGSSPGRLGPSDHRPIADVTVLSPLALPENALDTTKEENPRQDIVNNSTPHRLHRATGFSIISKFSPLRRQRRTLISESACVAQELIDPIIGLLHHSPDALRACALVSRFWVYAAQARIFRRVAFMSPTLAGNERKWVHFQEALDASSHLIGHTHQLAAYIPDNRLSAETFLAICDFPFSHGHLDGVSVRYDAIEPTHSPPPAHMVLSLSHLTLLSRHRSSTTPLSAQHSSTPVCLESLQIESILDGCPFDVSHLKALSVFDKKTYYYFNPRTLWPPIKQSKSPTLRFMFLPQIIDLSSFPKLVLLRISAFFSEPWPSACASRALQYTAIEPHPLCFNGGGVQRTADVPPHTSLGHCRV